MKIKKWHLGIIGIALFAIILSSIDLEKLLETFLQINLVFFAIVILLELINVILKGVKYKIVVKAHNESLSLYNSTKYTLIGFFLSLVTPGRVGELARAVYTNKKIHSLGKSISTVVIDRAIDLAILLSTGIAAVLFLSLSMEIDVLPIEAIAAIAAFFVLAIFLFSRKSIAKKFLKPIFNSIVPEKMKHTARTSFNDFFASLGQARKNKKQLAFAVFTGICIWAITVILMYSYLLALNIFTVPFYFVFILLPAIILVEILPISFSGLGTRDAACIILLGIFGVTAPQAVAFSILIFAVGYLLNAGIGFIFFSNEPIKGLEDLQ